MESPIQEDPYEALGVGKSANGTEIKSAYRKLVLKCHPDKVSDPTLKQQSADAFHRIQQAYEVLNDDEKRSRYDARVRLAELKAEMMRRESRGGSSTRGSVFERPTAPSYPKYEVRTPRFTEDDYEDARTSTRRRSPQASYTRRPSGEAQPVRSEKERRTEREEKTRSEQRRRAREADVRDSRDRKYNSSTEDVHKYEEERKKRDKVVQQKEEEARRYRDYAAKVEEARRNEEARRPALSSVYGIPHATRTGSSYDVKYSSMTEAARSYQASAEQSYTRPEPVRTSSHQYADVRRSRARRSPEINEEKRPGITKSATTPEILREMAGERNMPPRSYSHDLSEAPREYNVPHAHMRRADSMPVPTATSPPHISTSSSRRKEDSRSSKLRRGETLQPDSGYSSSSPVTPDATEQVSPAQYPNISVVPPPPPPVSIPRTTTYHYPSENITGDRLTVSPDKYTSSYKTEVRAPPQERERERGERRRDRDRPPMASVRTVPAPSGGSSVREHARAASYSHRSPDAERERDRARERERESRRAERIREMAYGELPSDYTKKNNLQPKSYQKEQVNVGRSFDYDDIKFSGSTRGRDDDPYMARSGRRERERGYDRPTLGRSSTFAY